MTAKTPQGDLTMEVQTTMVFPDKIAQQVDAPFGRMSMVATPAGAYLVGPGPCRTCRPEMKEELLRQVRRVPLLIAQKADDPRFSSSRPAGPKRSATSKPGFST